MRKLLVFQHVASEPLGHLDPLLRDAGFRIRYVNFGREPHAEPDIRRYDGLVVLGGPMNVDQVDRFPHLATEIDVIREAVLAQKPVLGICLGGQLLAAGDGRPRPSRTPCRRSAGIGCTRVRTRTRTACSGISNARRVTYSSGMPTRSDRRPTRCRWPGRAVVASRPTGIGDHAWGLQFHLEADAALIERWLHQPSGRSEIERHWDARRIAHIQAATRHHLPVAGR